MKRIVCLFLCFLLLFCGCRPESAEPDLSLNKGTFYTSAGNSYNTDIRLVLTAQELTSPVTSLSAELQNDTDYVILIRSDPEKYPWEKWEDGQWVKVKHTTVTNGGIDADAAFLYASLLPHSTRSSTNNFVKLDAGVYRLRVRVDVTNETETVNLPDSYTLSPENRIFAEVYFTIAPAPEA